VISDCNRICVGNNRARRVPSAPVGEHSISRLTPELLPHVDAELAAVAPTRAASTPRRARPRSWQTDDLDGNRFCR
jgi:hypothetical protein